MSDIQLIHIKELSLNHKSQIQRLWNAEYPANLAHRSLAQFDKYLNSLDNCSHFMLVDKNDNVLAWFIDFIRESEPWFVILVHTKHQGKGLGSRLLNHGKKKNNSLNGWVVDHQMYFKSDGSRYPSPLGFYQKQGFMVLEDCRLEKPEISAVKIRWTSA